DRGPHHRHRPRRRRRGRTRGGHGDARRGGGDVDVPHRALPRSAAARGVGPGPRPQRMSEAAAPAPEDADPRGRAAARELFAASTIVLFQELSLIRWLPGQVRVLAYYPNLVLLSAFLGLGLGCLRAGRRSLLWAWVPALIALILAAWALSGVVFT